MIFPALFTSEGQVRSSPFPSSQLTYAPSVTWVNQLLLS